MEKENLEVKKICLDFGRQFAKEFDDYNIERMCQNCTKLKT